MDKNKDFIPNVKPKPVLNGEEFVIYTQLLKSFGIMQVGHLINLHIQANLSSFVWCFGEFFSKISSWSVDYLITHRTSLKPLYVIEYYGGGHYGKNEKQKAEIKERDSIKAEIFRKIDVGFKIIRDSDVCNKDEVKKREYFNILLSDIVNDLALKI